MARISRAQRGNLRTPRTLFLAAFCFHLVSAVALAQVRPTDRFLSRLSSRSNNTLKVSFTYSPKYPVEGQSVQFVDNSSGSPASWVWDFGDGMTSAERNPIHIYSSSGFRRATLTVANGTTSKRASRTLTVLPGTAGATFVFSPATPGPGQTVQFADTTSGSPTSWRWNFGDGVTSTVKNPSHAFARTGSYTVSLTTTEGSSSKQGSKTLTVAGMSVLTSSFTYSPATPTAGQAIQFTDTSTGSPTSWLWNFGDGGTSTSQNPSHPYTTPGMKTVTLTVTNSSGSNVATRTFTVGVALASSFSFSPATPTAGQAIQFTDTSTGSPTSWLWNFGDGGTSTSQNPSHTYTTAGTKTVTLTVTNTAGSNSTSRTLSVSTALTASFTFSPSSPAVGQSVLFTDTSTGAPSIWQWNFGDGATSTARNPTHSYASARSYTVTLTIMNASSSNTTSRAVIVGAPLTASFVYSPSSPTTGQTVQFTDTSSGSPISWTYNFGDGTTSTSQNPSHAYSASGSYTVSLTVATSSMSQTASSQIVITPATTTLQASFSFSPSSPAPGQTVSFGDTSTGVPTSWQWNFGDGGTSTVQNPSHSYPTEGSYTVTLIAGNSSGSDTASRAVAVATSSDIIPSDRLYDWRAYSGVPGGIPARTTIYTTLTSSATASQIAAAVAACPAGQVVRLSAGTYNVGTLTISSANQSTLRGAGAGQTIINGSVSLTGGWFPTSADSWASPSAIASGYAKGSTTITLSTTPGASFVVGNLIQITQNDDYDLVWHREGNYAGTKNLRFTSRITGVSGNNISFATPIPYSYSARLNPICMAIATSNRLFGVENLTINGSVPVSMTGSDRCWFKDVEITGFNNAGITSYNSIQCEIQRCYFHDAAGFPSSDGYFILLQYGNSSWRIEDNIAVRCTMMIFNSASACFVGYNYTYDSRRSTLPLIQPSFCSNHGPHSIMNLWEGNYGQRFTNDGYHGSGSHDVLFRNNFHGTNTATGWTNERRLIDLVKGSYYESVVGNVLGDPSYTPTLYQAHLMASHAESFCYVLGWAEGGSADATTYSVPWTNWTASFPDVKVEATLFRHANYDYFHRATIYQSGVSQAIPPSLYYASRPSYFGSLQWPPIGPDVSGLVTNIPAQARWAAYLSSGSLADLFR